MRPDSTDRSTSGLRRRIARNLIPLAAAAAAASIISIAAIATASADSHTRFRATITCSPNPEMPITNGSFLVHWQADAFWAEGSRASVALERIAEIGNSRWSERVLKADPIAGCAQSGDTVQWEFNARPGDLLSTAQKLWNTNDVFTGAANIRLFDAAGRPRSTSVDLYAYDAGTEFNWPLFSPFRSGQPDASRKAENISNGVDTPDEVIALSDDFSGPQARLTVGPAGSGLPVGGTGGVESGGGGDWLYGLAAIIAGLAASALIIVDRRVRGSRS